VSNAAVAAALTTAAAAGRMGGVTSAAVVEWLRGPTREGPVGDLPPSPMATKVTSALDPDAATGDRFPGFVVFPDKAPTSGVPCVAVFWKVLAVVGPGLVNSGTPVHPPADASGDAPPRSMCVMVCFPHDVAQGMALQLARVPLDGVTKVGFCMPALVRVTGVKDAPHMDLTQVELGARPCLPDVSPDKDDGPRVVVGAWATTPGEPGVYTLAMDVPLDTSGTYYGTVLVPRFACDLSAAVPGAPADAME
jgi:hypothetical protein